MPNLPTLRPGREGGGRGEGGVDVFEIRAVVRNPGTERAGLGAEHSQHERIQSGIYSKFRFRAFDVMDNARANPRTLTSGLARTA